MDALINKILSELVNNFRSGRSYYSEAAYLLSTNKQHFSKFQDILSNTDIQYQEAINDGRKCILFRYVSGVDFSYIERYIQSSGIGGALQIPDINKMGTRAEAFNYVRSPKVHVYNSLVEFYESPSQLYEVKLLNDEEVGVFSTLSNYLGLDPELKSAGDEFVYMLNTDKIDDNLQPAYFLYKELAYIFTNNIRESVSNALLYAERSDDKYILQELLEYLEYLELSVYKDSEGNWCISTGSNSYDPMAALKAQARVI